MKKILLIMMAMFAFGIQNVCAQDAIKIVTNHPDFKIKVKRCAASGKTVYIDLILNNTGYNDVEGLAAWGSGGNASEAYDDEGNIYRDNSIKVKVYAVGGDFFQIHPIPLKNGNYLDLVSSDVNQILLDEYSAWLLFGSTEVAGMKVWIGNSVFTVTGVVQLSEDKDFLEAYGNSNAVYVPINAYSRADKKSDDKAPDVSEEEDEPLKVTCYEAVMPNPIKNYALNTVANAVGVEFKSDEEKEKDRSTLEFGGVEVVENTGRYKLIPLIQSYKKAKYVDMRTNSIVYPYWENIARYEERKDYRTLWTIAVLLIIPIATLIALIVYIYKNRRIFKAPFTKLKQFISNKMEERKTKRYYEMQKEKEEARLNDSESDDDESDDID